MNKASLIPDFLSSFGGVEGGFPPPLEGLAELAVCLLTAFVLLATDGAQQLIRVRSRMICYVWLFGAVCVPWLHDLTHVQLPSLCLAGSYFLLLRCYQRVEPVDVVFHCFLLLGLGSLLWQPMIVMALPMLCYLWILMRVKTWRTFWAAMIGLALPYILAAAVLVLMGKDPLACQFSDWPHFNMPTSDFFLRLRGIGESWPQAAAFLLILLLALVGTVHYLLTSFADKLRVRFMLRVFIFQSLFITMLAALLPAHLNTLTGLLLVSASPLIAHYFALVHNRVSRLLLIVSMLSIIAVAATSFFMGK